MIGAECNGPQCGRFGEAPNPGWLLLAKNPPLADGLAALFPGLPGLPGHGPTLAGTFCSPACVADYAYLMAVETGPATGTEMPLRSGTGWPAHQPDNTAPGDPR